jgi:thiamine biosynthesis protein ThiS
MSESIQVIANGTQYEITRGIPLSQFLESIGLSPSLVVVEHNGQALSPHEFATVALTDRDRLEIIHIVAGG